MDEVINILTENCSGWFDSGSAIRYVGWHEGVLNTVSLRDSLSQEMKELSESTPGCVGRGVIDLRHQNNV